MALLNYAISISWDGVSKRPNWMRQGEFIPCDCGECFFCVNGHTTGIAHKSRKKQKKEVFFANGEVLTTDKCTDVRVKLYGESKAGRYCKMYYRNKPSDLSRSQKMKKINYSILGCAVCKETVCDDCWEKGYDKHRK